MRIERVEAQGFRSFRDLEVYDFTQQPGLIRLAGRNEDEPKLGANGAGKSSLWEAVYWALYGKTSLGLKGPEVATWSTGRGVYVLVRVNGSTLVRSWSKNSVTIDGEDKTQAEIDAWVGLDAEQFLHCTFMAQHAPSFLDLGPQAKTDLVASVLRLDHWLDASKTAEAKLKQAEGDLRAALEDLRKVEGSIATLEGIDYEQQLEEWDEQRRKRVRKLQEEIASINELLPKLEATKDKRAERVDDARAVLVRCSKKEHVASEAVTAAREKLAGLKARADLLKHNIEECDHDTCPTCKQPWPRGLKNTAARLRESLEDIEEGLASWKTKARVAGETLDDIKEEFAERQQRLQEAVDELRDVESELKAYQRRLDSLAESVAAARSEPNPYHALARQKSAQLAAFAERRDSLVDEQQVLEAHVERVAYWVKGFKDVRLYMVAEALTQLEVEVNSALMQLGLVNWSIKFAPDAETKSGGVKRGFSVLITSPSNERPVPWEVWSGGERQRLRVAVAMGLSNLISSYTGFRPFVEVWDEPTAGVTVEGVRDMLAAFESRAANEGRQVWVVDHVNREEAVYSRTVTAVKSGGTTKLEVIDHGQGE